jgi:phage repressor protein C with HTH and peptisase S24 domain
MRSQIYDGQGPMKNPYATRLKALRQQSRRNFTDVARELKVSRQAVANWEKPGANAPGAKNLIQLAKLYGVDVEEIVAAVDNSGEQSNPPLRGDVELTNDDPAAREPVGYDVPLWGIAVGGTAGEFSFNGQVVDHIARPPGLRNARGVIAVRVVSDSMAPRYEPGETIYASPLVVPVAGDDVIVELNAQPGSSDMPAFIKRLVRRTADALICQQFNPPAEIAYPIGSIARLHKVFRNRDLFGA